MSEENVDVVVIGMGVAGESVAGPLGTMIYAYPTFHRGIEDALGQLEI